MADLSRFLNSGHIAVAPHDIDGAHRRRIAYLIWSSIKVIRSVVKPDERTMIIRIISGRW
jgi:hypothetical protein